MIRKNIYLDETSLEILKKLSSRYNISESLVIRVALSFYYNKLKKYLEDSKK